MVVGVALSTSTPITKALPAFWMVMSISKALPGVML